MEFFKGILTKKQMEREKMRLRKQELGDRNLVGNRVELVRKQKGMKQKELLAQLQVNGVDMNASGLSKLEGQIRFVTDVELVALRYTRGFRRLPPGPRKITARRGVSPRERDVPSNPRVKRSHGR